MAYNEEDFLQLSGLQHFQFCRRQWALIHIEHQWAENYRTIDGAILHENAHDTDLQERRGDRFITRGVSVYSAELGVSGQCDVLEYHRGSVGIPLSGKEALWQPYPVEYKRGRPREDTGDTLQLCAQAIVSFSYAGASPALMGKCAEAGIGLAFCSPHGRFLARTCGESSGNVLLRREQYRIADDPARSCEIARTMIFGKLSNGAASIQRTLRDHAPRVADCGLEKAAANLRAMLPQVLAAADLDSLRGIEGAAATAYFDVLDHMLLSRKEAFFFHGRSRRPPLDRVNAMLSFAYSLLAHDCASALESVGLDSYVGFLHRDRPGRQSLALDLMEELRPCMADRFVLTLVNNRMLRPEDFQMQDSGAVLLSDDGRRKFLKTWQERKQDTLTHPYLGEKLSWGMIPYAQALLLARCLRADLDGYPPFLWK